VRVLMISGVNAAATGGDLIHTLEMAGGLAAAGARVTLVLRGKYRGPGRPGVKVVGLPVAGWKYLDWLLRPVLMCAAALFLTLKGDPDAVYVRDSVYETPLVLLLGLLGRVVVLEVNAVTAEDLRAGGGAPWKIALAGRAQRRACLSATLVLPVTTVLAGWLAVQGAPSGRVVVVANGANPYLYHPGDRREALAGLGLDPARRYLCFAGNLAAWQGGEVVLEAFARLARTRPDTVLLVVGDGLERSKLEARARRPGLRDRVIFTGRLPYQRVPAYMRASVAGIGGGWWGGDRRVERRFRHSGSSALKVFSYLACGLPVVIPDFPDLAGLVRRAGCGLVTQPDRVEDLAAALGAVLDHPRQWAEAGLKGRAFIQREAAWEHRAALALALLEGPARRTGGGSGD